MLLKWVGGKQRLIDDILRDFPSEIDTYHEICLGGGAVLLATISRIPSIKKIRAYDLNPEIINLFKVIQTHPEEFIVATNGLIDTYNSIHALKGADATAKKPRTFEDAMTSKEAFYYWQRIQYNTTTLTTDTANIRKATLLYFLNKAGFRGLYRTGPRGFNVPFGNYRLITLNDEAARLQSAMIQKVMFEVASFEESLSNVRDGDFAYIDPPYVETCKSSFTTYMGKFDHVQLFNILLKMRQMSLRFIMSNSDADLVLKTFTAPLFQLRTIDCRRAINSTNPGASAKETIVCSWATSDANVVERG